MIKSIPTHDDPIRTLRYEINKLVPFDAKVIDVGAGMKGVYQAEVALRASRYVMLDAHAPYLAGNAVAQAGPPAEPKVAVVPGALRHYGPGEFDVALAIDVIEHLLMLSSAETIHELQRIANCVVVFTPEGYWPQHDHDEYHMLGEIWQEHRCGWWAHDLANLGFDVSRWERFHDGWAPKGQVNTTALFAVWTRR